MNDRDALYRHICANPDDDTPRMVFADWLQEHGEEHRAELIRLQCRLDGMAPDAPEWVDLKIREAQLLKIHAQRWTGAVADSPLYGVSWATDEEFPESDLAFERGFRSWASVMLSQGKQASTRLAKRLRCVFEATPNRHLQLYGELTAKHLAEQLAIPELTHLRGLLVAFRTEEQPDTTIRLLTESPSLTHLQELRFWYSIDAEELNQLNSWPALDRLRKLGLELAANMSTPLTWFLAGSDLSRLETLTLSGPGADLASLATVIGTKSVTPHTLELREMSYDNHDDGDNPPRRLPRINHDWPIARLSLENLTVNGNWLASLPELPRLASLRLFNAELWPDDLDTIAEGVAFSNLRELDLSCNPIGDGGLSRLAAARQLRNLRRLNLSWTDPNRDGLRDVLLSPHLGELRSLSLEHRTTSRQVSASTMADILATIDFPHLRHLDLSGIPLGVRGAKELASRACLHGLRSLRLANCRIGENGLKTLAESPYLAGLEWLDLRSAGIVGAAEVLTDPDIMPELRRCELSGNLIPSKLARRLRADPRFLL